MFGHLPIHERRKIKDHREAHRILIPKNLTPTVKHGGGGVMMWVCMVTASVAKFVFAEGIMNKQVYTCTNILKEIGYIIHVPI